MTHTTEQQATPARPGLRQRPRRPVTPARAAANDAMLRRLVLAAAPKPSAILSSARLERQQPTFERAIGGAMLGLSIAGTVALFQGRWGMPALGPLALGVAVQALLTYVQWMYRRRRLSWQYLAALIVDTGASVMGYVVVVLPPLRKLFTAAGFSATLAGVGAWLFILAAAGFLAYIPERILVKD